MDRKGDFGGEVDKELLEDEERKVRGDLEERGEVGWPEVLGTEKNFGRKEEGSNSRRGFGGVCDLLSRKEPNNEQKIVRNRQGSDAGRRGGRTLDEMKDAASFEEIATVCP